jgi:hypothetical protein
VTIGSSAEPYTKPSPPEPPQFECFLYISPLDSGVNLISDVRQTNQNSYKWNIAINPHGSQGMPAPTTCVMYWEASELGQGTFQMSQVVDNTETLVVSDMKATTSFDVTGDNKYFLYSIKQTVGGNIYDAILALQILADKDVVDSFDINYLNDKNLTLADAICVLRQVSGIDNH